MVLITPTFPFVMPPNDLNNKACTNEVEKANPTHDSTGGWVSQVPRRRTPRSLTCTGETNHQDGLAAEPAGVSDLAPHHGSEKLRGREAGTADIHVSPGRGFRRGRKVRGKTHCRTPAWLETTESGRVGSNHLSW